MKTVFTLSFICSILFSSIPSQSQGWLKSIGGASSDVPYGVAIDGSKNIYLGGAFSGTNVNFNPGGTAVYLTTAQGGDNGFISKYNAVGILQWVIPFYRGSGGTRVTSVVTDPSDNVYITGWFDGANVNFNPLGTAAIYSSTSSQDIFMAKYNGSGILQWVRIMGGASYHDQANAIAIDPTDNGVIITGSFSSTTNFNPGGTAMNLTPVTAIGQTDLFLAKYNSSGICLWTKHIGSNPNAEVGNSVVCDASGNIYLGGWFWSTGVNFNPGGTAVVRASSVSASDLFLAKYNNTGVLQWIMSGGGTSADNVNGVAVDASGNVYATGSFNGSNINFNPNGTASTLTSSGIDMFIVKYNSSGILQWGKAVGGTSSDRGRCVAVNTSGTVFAGGQFNGTNVNFNAGGTALPLTSAGTDAFVVAYTSAGDAIYGMALGGSASDDVKAFACDNSGGKYFAAGQYNGALVNFDPLNSTSTTQTSSNVDIFLGRYAMSNGHLVISTLPVNWKSIDAQKHNDKVALRWETACEVNNTGFTIERSTDGSNFKNVGHMASTAATDCGSAIYMFDDNIKGLEGKIYYRLKQIDIDGKSSYSKIVFVTSEADEAVTVQAYPNPAKNNFTITRYGSNGPDKAAIYNNNGKLVSKIRLSTYNNVDCSSYAPGVYYINYYVGEKLVKSDKLVIGR